MPRNAVSEAQRVGLGGVDAMLLPIDVLFGSFLVCAKIPVHFNHVQYFACVSF